MDIGDFLKTTVELYDEVFLNVSSEKIEKIKKQGKGEKNKQSQSIRTSTSHQKDKL